MSYKDFKEKYNVQLNEQQEEAVQAIEGAVLLLAVPGSGKTTVLVNRLGYMILDQQIAPEHILTVTYTVAATRDMKERFIHRFGEAYASRLEFRTINSLSQYILYYYGNVTGKATFDIIDNKVKASLIKNIFKTVNHAYATENDIKNIEIAITYTKNMRLTKKQMEDLDAQVDNFPDIYEMYQRELRKLRLIDYDDQMVYALMLLEKIPQVREYFQERYQYLCVDEAQDTSKLQHDMIHLLASKRGNLFMVGDEDQSIYGFRAAYPEALVSFEKVYPGARVLLMESNYRSNQEIVVAADRLIQKNKNRHEKHMQAARGGGGTADCIALKSRQAQFTYLRKVAENCSEETAVLYRNNESALPLIDMLERRHIPYQVKSNELTFFTHPVVSDISDYIRLALHPEDGDAFYNIYYKMGAGISKTAAMYAIDHNRRHGALIDMIDDLDHISSYTRKQCRALSTHFINMRGESPGKAVYRILHYMGYQEYMNERSLDTGKAEILQLLANQEERLEDFLPRLECLRQMMTDGATDGDSKFLLSTIHSSKGLEYDTVYLLDMLEGTLPSLPQPKGGKENSEDAALYEEERRLYYVGMTRAITSLHIFTFAEGETSAFTKEVFGRKQSTRKGMGLYQVETPRVIDGSKLQEQLKNYEQGVSVVHKKYGEGVVAQREGNMIDIYFFATTETRKFALESAVAKGTLKLKE